MNADEKLGNWWKRRNLWSGSFFYFFLYFLLNFLILIRSRLCITQTPSDFLLRYLSFSQTGTLKRDLRLSGLERFGFWIISVVGSLKNVFEWVMTLIFALWPIFPLTYTLWPFPSGRRTFGLVSYRNSFFFRYFTFAVFLTSWSTYPTRSTFGNRGRRASGKPSRRWAPIRVPVGCVRSSHSGTWIARSDPPQEEGYKR